MNKEISALSTESKLCRRLRHNYKKNSAGKDLMRKVSFEDKELNETVVVRKFSKPLFLLKDDYFYS